MAEQTRGLLLVGVGGQGVVLASNIVAAALLEQGHDVKKSEVHGMAQRGGVVYTHIRYGPRVSSPLLPLATAEVLVAFEWAEAIRWLPYLRPGGTVVASVDRIVPPLACSDRRTWALRYPAQHAGELRSRAGDVRLVEARAVAARLGNVKAANSVLLGVMADVLDVPEAVWETAIRRGVPPRSVAVNREAFRAGGAMVFPESYPAPEAEPAPVPRRPPRIEITPAWCKGCDICIRFCPEGCLALDEHEKVIAIVPEACTGCRLCELLCPDFAIAILPEPAPVVVATAGGVRALAGAEAPR